MTTTTAMRIDFTGSSRTLAELAAVHPQIDHFHAVEVWTDSDGSAREHVSHFAVYRDGSAIEVVEEHRGNADDVRASEFARVVGDEWHG